MGRKGCFGEGFKVAPERRNLRGRSPPKREDEEQEQEQESKGPRGMHKMGKPSFGEPPNSMPSNERLGVS